MFQPFQTLQVQLHKPIFLHHSKNLTLFSILFYAFPLFQFKIYNYNCTILILQLQTTFYNCTNCHQLHVKICPDSAQEGYYSPMHELCLCLPLRLEFSSTLPAPGTTILLTSPAAEMT